MQSLTNTTNGARRTAAAVSRRGSDAHSCAAAILHTVPGLLWYVRRHMRSHRKGLSVPQFRTLVKVQQSPDISLSCVAEHLDASLPTTSRIVAILVQKGYLKRTASTRDRRQITLAVTRRGASVVDAARAASIAQMELEFAFVPPADRAAVCRAMGILADFVAHARSNRAVVKSAQSPALPPRKLPKVVPAHG
ncbi:MAG TPA: MarR family transcriptional regulator [Phycisphaerae bacterium]|jgi:DNA-binding MarR family transcriptional regulator|nr:MarR family transcriptional regulator [Phycisphaerae bacterium]